MLSLFGAFLSSGNNVASSSSSATWRDWTVSVSASHLSFHYLPPSWQNFLPQGSMWGFHISPLVLSKGWPWPILVYVPCASFRQSIPLVIMTWYCVIKFVISAEKMAQKQCLSLYSTITVLLSRMSRSFSWVKPALRPIGSFVPSFLHTYVVGSAYCHWSSDTLYWNLVLSTMLKN